MISKRNVGMGMMMVASLAIAAPGLAQPRDGHRGSVHVQVERRNPPPRRNRRVVYVRTAPPEPRVYVQRREARPNRVWVEGHWSWTGRRYVWNNGRYLVARSGYVHVPAHWEQHDQGWVLVRAQWVVDDGRRGRDGDGHPGRGGDGHRDGHHDAHDDGRRDDHDHRDDRGRRGD